MSKSKMEFRQLEIKYIETEVRLSSKHPKNLHILTTDEIIPHNVKFNCNNEIVNLLQKNKR